MTTSESTTVTLTRLLTLTRQELVALSIFGSYFLLIISLFVLIGRSLLRQAPHASEFQKTKAKWFWCFALISFVYTWNSMIAFLTWSFRDFELNYYPNSTQYSLDGLSRLTAWLINSELFEQAWSIVCSGPMNWWWSEKLCLFTVGYWTIFLSTEGRTHKIPHVWAYMLLGQVVAISVAMNLFYVALSLFAVTQTKSQVNAPNKRPVPLILWFSTIASLLTIVYSPYTTPSTFLPNLLTMHAFIVLPLIFPLGQSGQVFDTSAIYTTVIFASVALHLGTTISTFITLAEHEQTAGDFVSRAIDTFFEHPAQTSISWDVVCTFVFTAIWEMWASRTSNVGRPELKKE